MVTSAACWPRSTLLKYLVVATIHHLFMISKPILKAESVLVNSSTPETNLEQTTFQNMIKKSKASENTMVYLSYNIENIVAKGNIAQFEQYFLWPQCFQKLSASMMTICVSRRWRVKQLCCIQCVDDMKKSINDHYYYSWVVSKTVL